MVRDFYERNELGQNSASDGLGVDRNGVPNASENGYGIDLGRPAYTRHIPPPAQVSQWVDNNHGFPGNFFEPIGNQTPDELGINGDYRTLRVFKTAPGEALFSGNGPVRDTWSKGSDNKPLPPKSTPGGGTQITVSSTTKEAMVCAVCGGRGRPKLKGTCTCWKE